MYCSVIACGLWYTNNTADLIVRLSKIYNECLRQLLQHVISVCSNFIFSLINNFIEKSILLVLFIYVKMFLHNLIVLMYI